MWTQQRSTCSSDMDENSDTGSSRGTPAVWGTTPGSGARLHSTRLTAFNMSRKVPPLPRASGVAPLSPARRLPCCDTRRCTCTCPSANQSQLT